MNDQDLLNDLRDVNPIPDPDRLLIEEAEAYAFLANVQTVRAVGPQRPPVERGPRRGWLVAVAAVVVVLAVGVVWLLGVIGSDKPVATTPQIESFSELTWSRISDDEAAFGGTGDQSGFAHGFPAAPHGDRVHQRAGEQQYRNRARAHLPSAKLMCASKFHAVARRGAEHGHIRAQTLSQRFDDLLPASPQALGQGDA